MLYTLLKCVIGCVCVFYFADKMGQSGVNYPNQGSQPGMFQCQPGPPPGPPNPAVAAAAAMGAQWGSGGSYNQQPQQHPPGGYYSQQLPPGGNNFVHCS